MNKKSAGRRRKTEVGRQKAHVRLSPLSIPSRPLLILGLMSGTSVDGIDCALVELERRPDGVDLFGTFHWTLRGFTCVAWSDVLRAAILDTCRPDAPLQQVTALHFRIGEAFADAAIQAAESAGVPLAQIDCIASHGQTVWHQATPFEIGGVAVTGTLQLGEASVIAARTHCLVVSDFRPADMALGGQGAPLVPFADYALLRSETETRVVQNIGGIANLTFLPKQGTLDDVIAFDTGPGNMLLDALAYEVSQGAQCYDRDGALAARGHVCAPLLESFLNEAYFALPPPKSTGREQFGQAFAQRFHHAAQHYHCPPEDILATATRLTTDTIARAYRNWLLPRCPIDTVIVGGGGARNPTLLRMLAEQIAPARLTTHAEYGLPDDAKESVAFALLAYETLHGRPSNVPSATGARGPAILGKITLPLTNRARLPYNK